MSRSQIDRVLLTWIGGSAAVSAGVVVVIAGFVAAGGWQAVERVGLSRFVAGESWHPTPGSLGLTAMILASLALMLGAVALAMPLVVASAVVYGFWRLVTLVPLVARWEPPGLKPPGGDADSRGDDRADGGAAE